MASIKCEYRKDDEVKTYRANITPFSHDTKETLEIKLKEEMIDVISDKDARIIAGSVEFTK